MGAPAHPCGRASGLAPVLPPGLAPGLPPRGAAPGPPALCMPGRPTFSWFGGDARSRRSPARDARGSSTPRPTLLAICWARRRPGPHAVVNAKCSVALAPMLLLMLVALPAATPLLQGPSDLVKKVQPRPPTSLTNVIEHHINNADDGLQLPPPLPPPPLQGAVGSGKGSAARGAAPPGAAQLCVRLPRPPGAQRDAAGAPLPPPCLPACRSARACGAPAAGLRARLARRWQRGTASGAALVHASAQSFVHWCRTAAEAGALRLALACKEPVLVDVMHARMPAGALFIAAARSHTHAALRPHACAAEVN